MRRDERIILIGEDIEGSYGGRVQGDEGPESRDFLTASETRPLVKPPSLDWAMEWR